MGEEHPLGIDSVHGHDLANDLEVQLCIGLVYSAVATIVYKDVPLKEICQLQELPQHDCEADSGVQYMLHYMGVDRLLFRSWSIRVLQEDEVGDLLRYASQVHEPDILDNKLLHAYAELLSLHTTKPTTCHDAVSATYPEDYKYSTILSL